jgi:hypothetical protein
LLCDITTPSISKYKTRTDAHIVPKAWRGQRNRLQPSKIAWNKTSQDLALWSGWSYQSDLLDSLHISGRDAYSVLYVCTDETGTRVQQVCRAQNIVNLNFGIAVELLAVVIICLNKRMQD